MPGLQIENDEGEQLTFRIVGPDEIYGRNDYISIDSPMARALIKKQSDDEVQVPTPTGIKEWWINKIWYPQQPRLRSVMYQQVPESTTAVFFQRHH